MEVREITAEGLKARLESGGDVLLLDVREPWEWQLYGHIEGAQLVPMDTIATRLDEFDKNASVVVYCHLGQRSWVVAEYMQRQGFTDVVSLEGGIESWQRHASKHP